MILVVKIKIGVSVKRSQADNFESTMVAPTWIIQVDGQFLHKQNKE